MTVPASEGVSVEEILQNVIESENLTNAKIKIQSGSEKGDGYVAINSAVEITSENNVLKLFVKAAPASPKLRELGFVNETFVNEAYFYKSIYPAFYKFQADRCVEIPFQSVPKCYGASTKHFAEAIVMENLKEQGYVLFDGEEMNEDHITYVFRQFARFHAVSYAMKDQEYELYEKLSSNMDDILVKSMTTAGMDKAFVLTCEDVKDMFADDTFISGKIENLTEILMGVYLKSSTHVGKYSIITQGDCWRNNMMFKYHDMSNRTCPSQMKIIDWQTIRVNYPVIDLSYFLYAACSKEIMANLDDYLKIYHDELSKTIRELGSDPDVLYPFTIFLEHWKKFCKYGLFMAIMVRKILLSEKDQLPDMGKTAEAGEELYTAFYYKLKDESVYKQKIRDLLVHFIENEYI